MVIEKASRRTKATSAYEALQAGILSGRIERGTHLRQEVVAAQWGMSQTPVREAFRRLESDGLVEHAPNRAAGADMVFVDGLRTREAIERAASELAGIPQVLNTHLLTPSEAQGMGFALYIQLGIMLRHFANFWAALNELRDTGNVTLRPDDASIDPITELLLNGVVRNP